MTIVHWFVPSGLLLTCLITETSSQHLESKSGSGGLRLSSWITDGMVLQSGTQGSRLPVLSGSTVPGQSVTLTLSPTDSLYAESPQVLTAASNQDGLWNVTAKNPLTDGSVYNLTVTSGPDVIHLRDILAGDVFICSGQSNMVYPTEGVLGVDEETLSLAKMPFRIFTVAAPQVIDIHAVTEPKEFLDNSTLCGARDFHLLNSGAKVNPNFCNKWIKHTDENASSVWKKFSSVCSFTARDVARFHTSGKPMGLVLAAVGGTLIEEWSPKSDTDACNSTQMGALYNVMLHPIRTMVSRTFLWYQGESNAAYPCEATGIRYACLLDKLLTRFNSTHGPTPVGLVSIHTNPGADNFQCIRLAEDRVYPSAGVAIAHDINGNGIGNWYNGHPPGKIQIAFRLALQVLAHAYGVSGYVTNNKTLPLGDIPVKNVTTSIMSPWPVSATLAESQIEVSLLPGSGTGLFLDPVIGHNFDGSTIPCKECCNQNLFEVQVSGSWYPVNNSAVSFQNDKYVIQLPSNMSAATATRYALINYIQCTVRNSDGLPMGPFEFNLVDNILSNMWPNLNN